MIEPSITFENIENCLDTFKNDFKNCKKKFEKFEDTLFTVRFGFRNKRSEVKDTLKEIHDDLLHELKRVRQCEIDKEYQKEKCKSTRDEFNGVLVKSRKAIDKLLENIDDLNVDINSQIKLGKENSEKSVDRHSNRVNLFILRSRQTEEPFKLMSMKSDFRHKCSGCNQNIPNQSLYLSHVEEYPAGSKTFIPHSYHVTTSCIFQRGFEVDYLKNISVSSDEQISSDIIQALKEIGFKKKNIQVEVFKTTDSHIKKDNNSDDFPDNVSELSDISSNPSVASSVIAPTTFIYYRKHPNQKKSIPCLGCKLNIDTETYITFENGKQFLPFHIKKACLKEGEVLPDDFSRATCKVFKLLQTNSQLKELMACGFRYNKIFGYRPSNSNFKRSLDKHNMNENAESNTDCAYIFNEEPFTFERLLHGEKCRGCQNQVRRDEMSLRHKERVPRDKLEYSPLISQYYHANKQCLLNRGFTIKYLSLIRCNAILAGNDNLSRITDVLIKSGFCSENIVYNPKDSAEPRGFEVASQCKLFMDNCSNSSSHCEGCGFILIPNQPCFIYALTAIQDSNSKMFHIRSSCLKSHFTKEQLIAMTCITNNNVNVSPNEIINCGVVKIESHKENLRYRPRD